MTPRENLRSDAQHGFPFDVTPKLHRDVMRHFTPSDRRSSILFTADKFPVVRISPARPIFMLSLGEDPMKNANFR